DVCVEVAEHGLGDWLETLGPLRQEDAGGASVVYVGFAVDQSVALEQSRHRRQRLLAETGAPRELGHSKPVLLEQGDEERAVGGADLVCRLLLEKKKSSSRYTPTAAIPVVGRRT